MSNSTNGVAVLQLRLRLSSLVRLHGVDDELGVLLDKIHHESPKLQQLRRRILRLQRELKGRVDQQTFCVYLKLEAVANERASEMLTLLFKTLTAGGHGRRP